MKIALAHDSFTQMGGAERVIEAFHEIFPDVPVFTLVFDSRYKQKYQGWDIRTSSLQTTYSLHSNFKHLLTLIPPAVDSMDFSGFDVILSSSSGFIKNINIPKGAIHINYCHTPTRFLWSEPEYVDQEVPMLLRPVAKWYLNKMKKWDYAGAQRVTHFIANSKEVQKRIKEYYHRESEVIYPFVNATFWRPTIEKQDYFLLGGRLQAHKKADLIIEIFNDLRLPLHVVGVGRDLGHLQSTAKSNITFIGHVSDEQLRDEYSGAKAFIFPQIEDFGLMPLEAGACGTPTIAYGHGGALESIISGQTGEFFGTYDKETIKSILLGWTIEKYSADNLHSQAKKFDKEKFKNAVLNFIKAKNENRG